MADAPGPFGVNHLLQALSAAEQKQLADVSEQVSLEFAQVLCEPGQDMAYVYFPLDGFISLVATLDESARVEVGMVGIEGMYGVDVALGVQRSGVQAVVQGAGHALRISVPEFSAQLELIPALRSSMQRFASVQMAQLTRTAVCNGFHQIEERLARWLLMCDDRGESASIHLTQRFLAYMLGVRRAGVTEAAQALHERQLIDYVRGEITILDRKGLEAAACTCYQADRDTYARAFG